MSERRILVVESEQVLCNAIRHYFERMGHVLTVVSAASPSEALATLHDRIMDLVLSVHHGPGGVDALQVLQGVQEQDLSVRTVVLADENLRTDRNRALTLGCTTFLVQPVPQNQLFDLVLNMLQPHQGFAGRLIRMRLEDVLQMFCYRRDTTLVTVFSEDNSVGSIYVSEGGIIHAECENLTGVDAAYEILGWESGEFYSQVVFEVPEQTIFIDSQSLLVEGMRQKDEVHHALGPVPGAQPTQPGLPGTDSLRLAPQAAPRRDEVVRRIMIVDDSRFIRKIVYEILKADAGLTVAGYASNGQEALAKIDSLKPDLILLDWDMPVMKGSTTLMHIMIRSPCPVVILSGFVGGVGANPFDLLCLGGVDFLRKPQSNWRLDGRADDLVRRVKEACAIKFDRIRRVKTPSPTKQTPVTEEEFTPARFLSVFGSFMGGCSDLIRVIPLLPGDLPSALVVIHDMQPEVVGAFVDYLDRRSRIQVRKLESGVRLSEGVCYIHPAMAPVELVREAEYLVAKSILEIPCAHVLDHFLVSASRVMGRNLLAVLLSGGSGGGIEGLRAVKQMEGVTMVQDPASCVDPRMAEAALQEGIVDYKCSADTLAETFRKLMSTPPS